MGRNDQPPNAAGTKPDHSLLYAFNDLARAWNDEDRRPLSRAIELAAIDAVGVVVNEHRIAPRGRGAFALRGIDVFEAGRKRDSIARRADFGDLARGA